MWRASQVRAGSDRVRAQSSVTCLLCVWTWVQIPPLQNQECILFYYFCYWVILHKLPIANDNTYITH